MSGINDVDKPSLRAGLRTAVELLSTASFSPEDGVEGVNASVPNIENEAATASTIEPISLRVSLLEFFIQIPYIPHF